MKVWIPSPLRSYTGNQAKVTANGTSVFEVLAKLETSYPGIRFRMIDEHDRIRQHIKLYVNTDQISSLDAKVKESDEVHIICALSGG